jgi:hypothetical protein
MPYNSGFAFGMLMQKTPSLATEQMTRPYCLKASKRGKP